MSRADEPFDAVQKPKHYNVHPSGIECYDFAKYFSFALGNAVKYLWRAGLKDGEQVIVELSKALWYLRHAIGEYWHMHPAPTTSMSRHELDCGMLLAKILPCHNEDIGDALQHIYNAYWLRSETQYRLHLERAIDDVEKELSRQQEPIVRALEDQLSTVTRAPVVVPEGALSANAEGTEVYRWTEGAWQTLARGPNATSVFEPLFGKIAIRSDGP